MDNYSASKPIGQSRAFSTFQKCCHTLFTAGDLSNLPAVPKYYSSSSTEIRLYESLLVGDSRQRSEFAEFGALAPWKTQFFIKFHDLWKCHVCTVATLKQLQLFAQPMDRAEAVHVASHIYVGKWKIGPIKNDWVESRKILAFPLKLNTLFTLDDLQVLPAVP